MTKTAWHKSLAYLQKWDKTSDVHSSTFPVVNECTSLFIHLFINISPWSSIQTCVQNFSAYHGTCQDFAHIQLNSHPTFQIIFSSNTWVQSIPPSTKKIVWFLTNTLKFLIPFKGDLYKTLVWPLTRTQKLWWHSRETTNNTCSFHNFSDTSVNPTSS